MRQANRAIHVTGREPPAAWQTGWPGLPIAAIAVDAPRDRRLQLAGRWLDSRPNAPAPAAGTPIVCDCGPAMASPPWMTEPGGNSGSRVTVVSGGGAAATVAPPSRIGRYAIEGLLGTGGMAVVYLARDPVLGRAVALKVMRVDGDEPGASRLVREGQALARISHPGVISVYEVGREADGTIYIAMERIVGATLAAWLETPRAPHEILRVFAAAGRGLSAAHAAGLVHRDFKPENAMVGDDGRVCVLDFGLAQPVRGAGPDADHDRVAGTPAYMSPEQWRGERAGAPAPAAPPGLTTPAAPATAPHAAPAWLRPHGDGARNGASLPATRRRRSPRAPVPRGPRPAVRCPDRPHGC